MSEYHFNFYTPSEPPEAAKNQEIVDFLYEHLGQYGDKREDIQRAIQYALQEIPSAGGMLVTMLEDKRIVGATVINKTGMGGYIPENILVYIAVHDDFQGQGLGKKLMKKTLRRCRGDVALHVEPDNPARHLYRKLGFENKYLEMRLSNPESKKRGSSSPDSEESPAAEKS